MKHFVLFVTSALAATVPLASIACGPENVKIDKLRGQIEYEHLNVYGVLTHDCPMAVGVQLHLTVTDAAGNIVDVRDQWPASVNNIPPNKPYTFALFANSGGKKSRFNVEPVAIRQWKQR
jgi:hypothetical protein